MIKPEPRLRWFVGIFWLWSSILCLGGLSPTAMAERAQPNFLLILADDMSPDDLAVLGNRYTVTPTLDALAARAVTFNDFSVTPLCAPSRATLLTGRHFLRTGVSHVHGGKDYLHLDEVTIADALRTAGYATGMWGKWHSGKTDGYLPHQRGFDEALSIIPLYRHHNPSAELNGKSVTFQGWSDEILVDHAIEFIRRHPTQPWFAYVASMTPHSTEDAPERWVEFYRKKGLTERIAKTYGMVSFLDEQLGRLFASLHEMGQDENTVVVFLSDNGPPAFVGEFTDAERATRNVSGRRGWKADLWQNGVKSPLFVAWPGHFQAAAVETPTQLVDLFPTFLELAGAKQSAAGPKLDGQSLVPALHGGALATKPIFQYAHQGWGTGLIRPTEIGIRHEYNPTSPEMRAQWREDEQVLSVREGRFKLLQNPDNNLGGGERGDLRLVDLIADPLEKDNVAAAHPEVVAQLQSEMQEWWRGILTEPHGFEAPIFEFPAPFNGAVTVLAYAPARVESSLLNTRFFLRDWHRVGQWAQYRVKVKNAGDYRVTLRWSKAGSPEGADFMLQVGDRKLVVPISSASSAGVALQGKQSIQFRPGDESFQLEWVKGGAPAPLSGMGYELAEILFEPVKP